MSRSSFIYCNGKVARLLLGEKEEIVMNNCFTNWGEKFKKMAQNAFIFSNKSLNLTLFVFEIFPKLSEDCIIIAHWTIYMTPL